MKEARTGCNGRASERINKMHGNDVPPTARKVKTGSVDFQLIRSVTFRQSESLVKAWLPNGRREGDEWVARNPTRSDNKPGSFKVNLRSGEWADFATTDKGGDLISLRAFLDSSNQSDAARKIAEELGIEGEAPVGLTLEAYAAAKHLPVDFLRSLGLETIADPWGKSRRVLAIPYRKRDGSLHRNRLRVSLHKSAEGSPRMFWDKRSDKIGAVLYGLDQLPARDCPVILVEGESDAPTLWHHGFDAVAVPGSGNYAPGRDDAELDSFDIIAFVEPDQGGDTIVKQLAKSRHKDRIKLAKLDGFKDVSEVHIRAPERFEDIIKATIAAATSLDKPAKRREIKLDDDEQARVTDEAIEVIKADGTLYERGGVLVRLSGETIVDADAEWLTDHFTRRASFYRMKERDGELKRVNVAPPVWLGKRLAAKRGERGLVELRGIITAPTLRRDGSLLDKPGFDDATGLLLKPGAWPKVTEQPTRADVEAAWKTLWLPYAEFPYVSNDDRAVAMAAILTAIVRRTLPLAPAFSFDAPTPSSGKTLLASCVCELCGGEHAILGEADEEEIRKALTAVLLDGAPAMLFDNVVGAFKSSTMQAFLTSERFAARVLGASKLAKMPSNVFMAISGNNFLPVGDLWRRILTCRIDPRTEAAHLRTFKLDALQHVRTHRQEMIAAGLTLLRAFIAAGSPRSTKDKLGSYEVFDDLERQCVIWLGNTGVAPVTDPAISIAKTRALEPELQRLTAFLAAVHLVMGDRKWRVAELIAKANTASLTDENGQALHETLVLIAGDNANRINVRILGAWITKQADRRCSGFRVERAGVLDGNNRWRIATD
jgi:hypothetical protein